MLRSGYTIGKVWALVLLLCCGSGAGYAQGGRTGLGITYYPDGGGISFKYFLDQNLALGWSLNAGGATRFGGTSISTVLMLQYHFSLPDPSLRLFFGGGAYGGYWSNMPDGRGRRPWIAGVGGVGGFEYFFKKVPLGLYLAFTPKLNYIPYTRFFAHNIFGIGGHYYFGRRPKQVSIPATF